MILKKRRATPIVLGEALHIHIFLNFPSGNSISFKGPRTPPAKQFPFVISVKHLVVANMIIWLRFIQKTVQMSHLSPFCTIRKPQHPRNKLPFLVSGRCFTFGDAAKTFSRPNQGVPHVHTIAERYVLSEGDVYVLGTERRITSARTSQIMASYHEQHPSCPGFGNLRIHWQFHTNKIRHA